MFYFLFYYTVILFFTLLPVAGGVALAIFLKKEYEKQLAHQNDQPQDSRGATILDIVKSSSVAQDIMFAKSSDNETQQQNPESETQTGNSEHSVSPNIFEGLTFHEEYSNHKEGEKEENHAELNRETNNPNNNASNETSENASSIVSAAVSDSENDNDLAGQEELDIQTGRPLAPERNLEQDNSKEDDEQSGSNDAFNLKLPDTFQDEPEED
ncbi:MAG: hypothetical protein ACRC2T_03835, partial [Thermoguttaceae bacterium]